MWSILYPRRRQRFLPTLSGTLLITVTIGIGVAAYNTSNNILFITLSLLLSCLILSGLLSWMNVARVVWRVTPRPPWRVGQTAVVAIELKNNKRLLPTYALTFEVLGSSIRTPVRLTLHDRLEPGGGEAKLEWTFRPLHRGRERVELVSVGSLFPFGFLRKSIVTRVREEAWVWPAPVEYQRHAPTDAARSMAGETVARIGQSDDLLALRRYEQGDSHRLIHWKASARLGHLMVRQHARETQEAYLLWLDSTAAVWPRTDQFELLCSFATTFAEDLFREGRLAGFAVNAEPVQPVRRLRDLEAFFDRVAALEPLESGTTVRPSTGRGGAQRLLTFAPDGTRGVAAFVDGNRTATA